MIQDNAQPPARGGSLFDSLLGGADVDSELRSFLDGVPGVTLPTAQPAAASVFEPAGEVVSATAAAFAAEQAAAEQAAAAAQARAAAEAEARARADAQARATAQAEAVAQAREKVKAEVEARGRAAAEAEAAAERQAQNAAAERDAQNAAAEREAQNAAALRAASEAKERAEREAQARAERAAQARAAAVDAEHTTNIAAQNLMAAPISIVAPESAVTSPIPVVYDVHTPQHTPSSPEAVTQIIPVASHAPAASNDLLPDFTERPAEKKTVISHLAEVERILMAQNPEVDPEFVIAITAILDSGASDLHLCAESTPVVRLDGQLQSVAYTSVWDRDRIERVIDGFVSAEQMRIFDKELELDLAYAVGDLARFRVNIFRDQRGLGAALRIIPTQIKSVQQLGLPKELIDLANLPRGLVLVCGPTGSGKSTTLAAIVDRANSTRASHIVTVEDPIEFLHHHKRGIINQREVGADTHSFSEALKHALRQDPDIILVGEMRDLETISTALTAAETGHLVFATLHTQDAGQTIDRIIDVYPAHQQAQVRTQLAATLRAVVVQTLLPRAGGKGRAVATEVMFTNPAIQALIRAGKTHQLRTALQAGSEVGMHTLDQDLARLVLSGEIEYSAALDLAQDVTEFNQLVRSRGLGKAPSSHPEGTRQTMGA